MTTEEIEKTAAELVKANQDYDEALKNANALEAQARHIRTVIAPELKDKRNELNNTLTHQRTIKGVNDAVQVAKVNAASTAESKAQADEVLSRLLEREKRLEELIAKAEKPAEEAKPE